MQNFIKIQGSLWSGCEWDKIILLLKIEHIGKYAVFANYLQTIAIL